MFEPFALPLMPTAAPVPSLPLANTGTATESADLQTSSLPAPDFAAMLTVQSAPVYAPITAPAAGADLPESGKTLPVPASGRALVAAPRQPGMTPSPVLAEPAKQPASPADKLPMDALQSAEEQDDDRSDSAATPLPDMAMLTAIFAAADRPPIVTTPAPLVDGAQRPLQPDARPVQSKAPAEAAPTPVALSQPVHFEMAHIELHAIASQPQADGPDGTTPLRALPDPATLERLGIAVSALSRSDRVPTAGPALPEAEAEAAEADVKVPTADAVRPTTPPRTVMHKPATPDAGLPAADKPQPAQGELAAPPLDKPLATEQPIAESLPLAPSQPQLPVESQAPGSARMQPAPERVDFATLVDALSRAREDSSAGTVHASVRHAEFGRVSLRFDRDEDNGLSVAMSSADPGFTRAVSAAAQASPTSAENAGQTARQHTTLDQRTGQGESQRQQQQNPPAQQRPAANVPPRQAEASLMADRGNARDIYA